MANAETAKEPRIYKIPAQNLENLQDRIAKLQKRAAKLGVPEIVLRVSGLKKEEVAVRDHNGKPVTKTRVYYEVEVQGEAPKYAGWTLVAALQYIAGNGENEAAMFIRTVPGQTLPESFRHADQKCDHCGLARRRNETFVVRHEDGTLKQIGRQCIADFLGHQNPENILACAEWLLSAADVLGEAEDEGWGGGGKKVVWLSDYLSYVALAIRTGGWLSRSKARELPEGDHRSATADEALSIMFPFKPSSDDPKPESQDIELAGKAIEWLRGTLAHQAELNDYQHNLVVICSRDAVVDKGFGIAASLIQAYKREMGMIAEQKARFEREVKSEFFGEVCKREVFTLTVVKLIDCEGGEFGPVKLHKFFDQNGNVAAWFSTGGSLEIGKTYRVRATVKAHEEYNGVKQTMLTRCAVDDEWYCPACRRTNTPDAQDQKAVCDCGAVKGSWVCLNCRKVNGPEAKTCECGHDLKSWLCPKCRIYNTRKVKACQAIDCGTPKKAWSCRTWQCGKWNDEKIEVCACGADKTGYMQTPAAPGV